MMAPKKTPKIEQRGPASWRVQVELGRDPVTGERRRRRFTVTGKKGEAERALRAAEYERDHGVDVAPDRATVADLLRRWLRDYAAVSVERATQKRYRELAEAVISVIGAERAQALRPAHVQKLHAELLTRGLAPRTVVHHHRVLRQALAWAVEMQLLIVNPADAVKPPRPERREMLTLDTEGVAAVLNACESEELRALVFVALQTGLRQGELLALRWQDIDLDFARAAVHRSLSAAGGMHFKAPKTARGRRSIALSASTVAALRAHKRAQAEHRLRLGPAFEDNGLVFPDALGSPQKPWNVTAAFKRATRVAGAPSALRFHDLRHTAASLALRAGVHPKVVSERLGHASVQITLDTYSHVLPDLQRDAAELMDAYIRMPDRKEREG